MAVMLGDAISQMMSELRVQPHPRRLRAELDGTDLVRADAGFLVWEPRRVVPSYAVPTDAVIGDLTTGPEPDAGVVERARRTPVWDPRVPFAVHSIPGRPVRVSRGGRSVDGFLPDDPTLDDHVVLDFDGPDAWFEESERVLAHPRDPFHRIDVLGTDRHVQLRHEGDLLLDTTRARILFETTLPPRFYAPRDDVRVPLEPSPTRTRCAYKGEAEYFSTTTASGSLTDIAWTYREVANDGVPVRDLIAFYQERLDVVVDGEPVPREATHWS